MEYIYKKVLIGFPAEWGVGDEGLKEESYVFEFVGEWMVVLLTERGNVENPYLLI